MAAHRVQALLMGGQACVFYGAAEFSRDTDLAILASPENFQRLAGALRELSADCIAVPPFDLEYLKRGHALHFRCQHPAAAGMRVDVMSVLRGLDAFPALWERRTTITDRDNGSYELLALPDLVKAKKTQRSKDWPMIRRLLEAHYLKHRLEPNPDRIDFWLSEIRTAQLLIEAARMNLDRARKSTLQRPLLNFAIAEEEDRLTDALIEEENGERERDRVYWKPLKEELERLRHPASPSRPDKNTSP